MDVTESKEYLYLCIGLSLQNYFMGVNIKDGQISKK